MLGIEVQQSFREGNYPLCGEGEIKGWRGAREFAERASGRASGGLPLRLPGQLQGWTGFAFPFSLQGLYRHPSEGLCIRRILFLRLYFWHVL